MRVPVPSSRVVRVAIAAAAVLAVLVFIGLVVAVVNLAGRTDELQQGRARLVEQSHRNRIAAQENAAASKRLAQQVEQLGGEPVVEPEQLPSPAPLPSAAPEPPSLVDQLELQQPEIQQPERQQDERQQAERQNPERQQDERQQDEIDQPEPDDPEVDQPEPDDPEVDQPEPDDPEPDDPEPDDPDPNSALTFNVEDNCNPADGEFVTDVSATFRRDPGTLTLVLTCTTAVPPAPPGQQP